MSLVRQTLRGPITSAVDLAISVAGRKNVVRLSRFVSNRARLDVANHPTTNGESLVQALAARLAAEGDFVLDVGANVGGWARMMLDECDRQDKRLRLVLFEPDASTCALLTEAADLWVDRAQVEICEFALSSETGEREFFSLRPGAGINSLFAENLHGVNDERAKQSIVSTVTVDDMMRERGISQIVLLKVDTEGHDVDVLLGAEKGLASGSIQLAQFEYNHRWVFGRHFLRDAFALANRCGLEVGKITPNGIEVYPEWHPELESFREGNYLMFSADLAEVPTIKWWGP